MRRLFTGVGRRRALTLQTPGGVGGPVLVEVFDAQEEHVRSVLPGLSHGVRVREDGRLRHKPGRFTPRFKGDFY